ncbi:MAG: hypothetical protein M3O29_06060 [Actinomycetota bacterium]|nr:hypothetical protein [Actinomycetota bacterium]
MAFSQTITPNPNIPCRPGWCLAYVNEAFGAAKRYGSATAAWEASTTQHADRDFPEGCWVPVWYELANEPAGHVVLLAPDGSVYSTSDLTNTPHHHPNLADLEWYYAYYGMPLTYRGWTEDVEGTPVIASGGIAAMGSIITPQEEPLVPNESDEVFYHLDGGEKISLNAFLNDIIREARSAAAAAHALLSVQLPDPSEPGKTYTLADYIVWGATNAKNAAGAAGVAAGNTSPEALAKAVSEAQTGATAQAIADQLQISVKGK